MNAIRAPENPIVTPDMVLATRPADAVMAVADLSLAEILAGLSEP